MLRGEFVREVYAQLKCVDTHSRICFGIAWAAAEGSEARNNAWDTTEDYPDSTNFNTEGVKNYRTWRDGVLATCSTLIQDPYKHLLELLRNEEATVDQLIVALNESPWGTHLTARLYEDVVDNPAEYDIRVAGSPEESEAVVAPEETQEEVVPEPIQKEDTLEDRLAAQAQATADAIPVPPASTTETSSSDTTTGETVVPAPVEKTDTLEDRLAKVAEDVKAEAEKVADDVKDVVDAAPGVTTDWESRLAKLEKFATDVVTALGVVKF